jgi:predicted DNA-binding transcriptional regulator AlpA
MDHDEKFLTLVECAELIGCTPGAVRNLVMRRMIPYRKPAGRLVFLTTEIEQWIYQAPGVTFEDIQKEREVQNDR